MRYLLLMQLNMHTHILINIHTHTNMLVGLCPFFKYKMNYICSNSNRKLYIMTCITYYTKCYLADGLADYYS